MIAIIDYGLGNLRSVEKALQKLGHTVEITSNPAVVLSADRVILPGVGAFRAGMDYLNRAEAGQPSLAETVRQFVAGGRPFFGICLGMQLLFSVSEELGRHPGLDLVPGDVVKFDFGGDPALKIPHMGWNELQLPRETALFAGVEPGAMAYFVHSYYCRPADPAVSAATCTHGIPFCAGLAWNNIYATQFHPEKSGATGMRILDNFARL